MRIAVTTLIALVSLTACASIFSYEQGNNQNDKPVPYLPPGLHDDIASAELIVVGEVIDIRKLAMAEPISEHSPDWHIATIRIDRSLKWPAELRGMRMHEIGVVFPMSQDVMWFSRPKPKLEQKAVFILKRVNFRHEGPDFEVWTLPTPLSIQPLSREKRIKKIVEAQAKK